MKILILLLSMGCVSAYKLQNNALLQSELLYGRQSQILSELLYGRQYQILSELFYGRQSQILSELFYNANNELIEYPHINNKNPVVKFNLYKLFKNNYVPNQKHYMNKLIF